MEKETTKIDTSNDERKIVRSYLNDIYTLDELLNIFDLVECPLCHNYELEEDMTYHKWDIGQVEEKICETCRGDEQWKY